MKSISLWPPLPPTVNSFVTHAQPPLTLVRTASPSAPDIPTADALQSEASQYPGHLLTARLVRGRALEVLRLAEDLRRQGFQGAAAYQLMAYICLGDDRQARTQAHSLRPSDFHRIEGLRPPSVEAYLQALEWIVRVELSQVIDGVSLADDRSYQPARRAQSLAALQEAYQACFDLTQIYEVRDRVLQIPVPHLQLTEAEQECLFGEALLRLTQGRGVASVFDLAVRRLRVETSALQKSPIVRRLAHRLYALSPRLERAEWLLYTQSGARSIGLARIPNSGLIVKDFHLPAAINERIQIIDEPQAPRPQNTGFSAYALLLASPAVPQDLKEYLIQDLEFARRRMRLIRGAAK